MHGVPCVPSLDALDEAVDAVVVATPADTVPDLLDTAGRLGCGGAVVFAAEFAETGRTDRQEALVAAAATPRAAGDRAERERDRLGRAAGHRCGATTSPSESGGGVALITQSGNLGVVALASRRGIAWHTVVSVGNSAVVDAADALTYLAGADGVRSVALYLEGDGDGARWAEAFAHCAERDVRVAVLKAGRSAAGQRPAAPTPRRWPATTASSPRWSPRPAARGATTRTSCSRPPSCWRLRDRPGPAVWPS